MRFNDKQVLKLPKILTVFYDEFLFMRSSAPSYVELTISTFGDTPFPASTLRIFPVLDLPGAGNVSKLLTLVRVVTDPGL